MDAQVFQCRTPSRAVTHILHEHAGSMEWCPITGIDDGGAPCRATACLVEDSGDGACYLVVGGDWGLRLKPPHSHDSWDLSNSAQWGVPYFLLGGDGSSLQWGMQ